MLSTLATVISGKIYMTLAASSWISTILSGLGDILSGIFNTLIYAAMAAVMYAFYPAVQALYLLVYEILMPALFGMCKMITGEYMSSMYADALMVNDGGTFSTALKGVFSITADISNILIVYGVVFTIIFFMMDMYDRSTRDDLDIMSFLKQFITMIAVASLISITPQAATTIITLTGDITKEVFDEVEQIKGTDLNTIQIDADGTVVYNTVNDDNTIAAKLLNGMMGVGEGYSLIRDNGEDYKTAVEAQLIVVDGQSLEGIWDSMTDADQSILSKVQSIITGVLDIFVSPISISLKLLVAVLMLLIPFIVILGINVFCLSIFITRGIQLAIYTVFMPIAIVDMYHNGVMSSTGIRYIKKFAAIGLQGIVLYVCLVLAQAFLGTIGVAIYSNNSVAEATGIIAAGGNGLLFLIIAVATAFTSLSLALKSQQIANDIIG